MANHKIEWNQPAPEACLRGVATIGNFDGVHRGHRLLLDQTRRQARSIKGPALAITFDPHPFVLLRPGHPLLPLTTLANRTRLLHDAGADEVLILHTTPGLLALTAGEFFHEVLRKPLHVQALVEGMNFRFGHDREGTVATLGEMCRASGVALTVAPPEMHKEQPVSSSRIRTSLSEGNVEEAAALLGRAYALEGTVGVGQQRGRQLGFPTANLTGVQTLIPRDGVYAVRVHLDGQTWPGAMNLGPNPTFGETERKVEVHLIGFKDDLYQKTLQVDFLARLRDTRPFANRQELIDQLERDVREAEAVANQVR